MTQNFDQSFMQLILTLQAGAMQQMGKVISPITGKVERDLEIAKTTIDMIEMLENKTKGNLTEDETKLLDHVLYELRMNYIDETKKGDSASKSGQAAGNQQDSTEAGSFEKDKNE